MANWKFWQRKQVDNSELPEEVREYYESTRRSRTGSAFLLGLATLIITLALAALLYFAGRFVWQQFTNDEPESPVVTEQVQEEQSEGSAQNDDQSTEQAPAQLPGDGEENATDNRQGSTGSGTNGSQESTANGSTRRNGNGVSQTPDTGPGDTLAIFVGATIVGTLTYELLARKKQTN